MGSTKVQKGMGDLGEAPVSVWAFPTDKIKTTQSLDGSHFAQPQEPVLLGQRRVQICRNRGASAVSL